jgi:hypothetical protein
MKLGDKAVFVGAGSSGEALAKFLDFLIAGTTATNFRTTAGCGHAVLLGKLGIKGPSHSQQRESEWNLDYRGARVAKANRTWRQFSSSALSAKAGSSPRIE